MSSLPRAQPPVTRTPPHSRPLRRGSTARGGPDSLGPDAELEGRDEVAAPVLGDRLCGVWGGEREARAQPRARAHPEVGPSSWAPTLLTPSPLLISTGPPSSWPTGSPRDALASHLQSPPHPPAPPSATRIILSESTSDPVTPLLQNFPGRPAAQRLKPALYPGLSNACSRPRLAPGTPSASQSAALAPPAGGPTNRPSEPPVLTPE